MGTVFLLPVKYLLQLFNGNCFKYTSRSALRCRFIAPGGSSSFLCPQLIVTDNWILVYAIKLHCRMEKLYLYWEAHLILQRNIALWQVHSRHWWTLKYFVFKRCQWKEILVPAFEQRLVQRSSVLSLTHHRIAFMTTTSSFFKLQVSY